MRCAIYCRLSREDEDKLGESESIQNQKALLGSYAREQQWDIVELYCDEDYSGADRNRPDFNRMLSDAREHRFDLILCKTQSRFTRDMELVERYLHGLFPLWGIRFIALADHIDTDLQGNKKARQINGLVNEWYLEDLSENIRMVLNHKRRQGAYIGGFPLYGYCLHPTEKGRLLIDPEAAAVVRQIFRWAVAGHGKQQIADLLNARNIPNPSRYKQEQGSGYVNGSMRDPRGLWNRSSVGRILHNEMYLGVMVQGTRKKLSYKSQKLLTVPREAWFRVEGTHAPIIERELFDAVASLHQRRSKSDGSGEVHPFAGIISCLSCGSSLQKNASTYKGSRHSYLRCPNKSCPAKLTGSGCSISLDTLLSLAQEQVEHYALLWYHPAPTARAQQDDDNKKLHHIEAAHTALSKRQSEHIQALQLLYLDRTSGLVTPEQFRDISRSLSGEIELCRQGMEDYDCQARGIETARCTLPQACSHTVLPNPLPRALIIQLIAGITVGAMEKQGHCQAVHINWRF